MTASVLMAPRHDTRALYGQTVVVIGGTSGIGLATGRVAREQGAVVIITAHSSSDSPRQSIMCS